MRKLILFLVAAQVLSTQAAQKNDSIDGQYYRLFTPLTFYHNVAGQRFSLRPTGTTDTEDAVSRALMRVYLERPDLIQSTETEMQESGSLREDIIQASPIEQQVELVEQAPEPMPDDPITTPIEVAVEKPNFWKFKGDGYLQFMQNYISDNWYKGGESNYSAVGSLTLEANYDNKSKWKWDNKLEMKLGFQTSRSDTVNRFKTNEDLIRLTSKVGLQATQKWYYTLQVLAKTQIMRGLKANNDFTFSDFMSPFNLNFSLGMEYKANWFGGRFTGTGNFSPLAIDYVYVDRSNLAPSFGVKSHHNHSLTDFGSQMTFIFEWKLNNVTTWKSRFYAFTSYHRAQIEWENTFSLRVSKYISANLFLFPRFDDSNLYDDELGYWQFKEYSSLGFAYTF